MDVSQFDFELPDELIAQEPPLERGGSRLLVVNRTTGDIEHAMFNDLSRFLRRGDVLVVNNSRVFPARLLGHRVPSGGAVECLLVRRVPESVPESDSGTVSGTAVWEALVHPGQKLKPGARVVFEGIHTVRGEILERRFF